MVRGNATKEGGHRRRGATRFARPTIRAQPSPCPGRQVSGAPTLSAVQTDGWFR